MIALAVALAGGVGAGLRFVVDGLVGRYARARLPLGTVVVNVTGSFLLGLVTGLVARGAWPHDVALVVGTGMLGGYTTFSTASVEAVNLALAEGPRAARDAALHAGGMLVASVAAAAVGLALT